MTNFDLLTWWTKVANWFCKSIGGTITLIALSFAIVNLVIAAPPILLRISVYISSLFNNAVKKYPFIIFLSCFNNATLESNVNSSFKRKKQTVLNDISLSLNKGDSIALIGESGCGKSTLGKIIAGLLQPDSGEIMWKQTAIQNLSPRKRKALRKDIQMIYQNSTSTFHPLQSIGTSIAEPLLNYKLCTKAQAKKQVTECMEQVGLSESFYQRLPKELSGGQRQRANIARGIILHPQLIVCDEVVSSLDFSLRTQILNLLNDLKKQYHLSYLFISHDLSTVKYVCNKAIIMYRGVIVEKLETTEHLEQTVCHPYSKELFAAVPVTSPFLRKERHISFPKGWDEPSTQGCVFQNRCTHRKDICKKIQPQLREMAPGHFIACHVPYQKYKEK